MILQDRLYLKIICFFCVVLMMLLSNAYAGTDPDLISTTMCKVIKLVNGGLGKGVATIAIFTFGGGLFMGKVSWPTALMIAVAIAIIFGSEKLITWISDDQGYSCK